MSKCSLRDKSSARRARSSIARLTEDTRRGGSTGLTTVDRRPGGERDLPRELAAVSLQTGELQSPAGEPSCAGGRPFGEVFVMASLEPPPAIHSNAEHFDDRAGEYRDDFAFSGSVLGPFIDEGGESG